MQIRKSSAPKNSAKKCLRDIEILKLRGEQRLTMPQIAAAVGVGVATVHRSLAHGFALARAESTSLAKDIRDQKLNDYDGILLQLAERLEDPAIDTDEYVKIVDRIIKVNDQIAKLVGAYAAVKTEAEVVVSGPQFVPKDELLQKLRERGVAIDVVSNN